MSRLIRHYSKGNLYFLTAVTAKRRPILIRYREHLEEAIRKYRRNIGFDLIAHVVLPDHMHMLLDPGESTPSKIMQRIKLSFSKRAHNAGFRREPVWQRRFWDHVIRDQEDMNRHIDYIHYNPVKHGLVKRPGDWRDSSFREFRGQGYCQADWGCKEPFDLDGEYGE